MVDEIIGDVDREIVKRRALGYKQAQIAKDLGISQATVSLRLEAINKRAQATENKNELFWTLVIDPAALSLLKYISQVK